MLGRGSMYADVFRQQGFIGAHLGIDQDLTGFLGGDPREFNQQVRPIYLSVFPEKSKGSVSLSCGYLVGEVTGEYRYVPGDEQPHQRPVAWHEELVNRSDMSESLRNSAGSIGTVSNVSKYREELEQLIKGEAKTQALITQDPTVEDATVFALEKHLEDFLVANWSSTPLGRTHDLYETEESGGQQFPTDTGPIDLLAISKDWQEFLVVELKRGRASDAVVGQIQRYMGYVQEEIAEDHQRVRGVIIALDDDKRIRRALQIAQGIDFYRYEVNFNLIPSP